MYGPPVSRCALEAGFK